MQLKGVTARWPETPAAAQATNLLIAFETKKDNTWEAEDIADQLRLLVANARGLDAYASGEISAQYLKLRPQMAKAAIERVAAKSDLSNDVREVVTRALAE